MLYKSKHSKKSKYFKHIKRKERRHKLSMPTIMTIGFIIISFTVFPTFAYVSKYVVPNLSLNGGNQLNIQNGYVELQLNNDASTNWSNVTPSTPEVSSNSIIDPVSDQEISYGPVYVMTPQDLLSNNLNIQTEYNIKKNGGTPESSNNSTGSTLAEPFEAISGDLDNFNFGAGTYDFYSGKSTTEHSIEVFPQNYDSQGTDRRMVPSGFYQLGTQIFTKVDGANVDNGLKIPSINATCTAYSSKAYYGVRLDANTTVEGKTYPRYLEVFYDGYTDRGLTGKNQADTGYVSDHILDGVNWKYLQKSKPITLKYNTIPQNNGISSVNFQIFIDDMQSGDSTNPTEFANYSTSYFKVYLSQKDGANKIEVPEFSKIINKYAQSGPIGNIVNLNLPSEYFSIIKNASGLDGGLELLIDDTRVGTSGDSFAIDFAKMTVNKEAAKGASNTITQITGTIIDSNSVPISGVKVVTGDGKSVVTDANGNYTITGAAPGLLNLTFSHYQYKTETYVYGNVSNGTSVAIGNQILYKGLKSEIPASEKVQVDFTIQKCDLTGTAIGEPIVLSSKDLNSTSDFKIVNTNDAGTNILYSKLLKGISAGSRYKITYSLKLKSYGDIGDIAQFNLLFSSRIRAKLTQENNPSWAEDGTGSNYITSISEPNNGTIIEGSGTGDSNYSEIYFERPTTAGYWADFSSGALPLFYLNSTTALDGSKITKFNSGSDWYKYTFDNNTSISDNSYIKIVDGGNAANTSSKLYYFSTQKIFVCTN
jgi:hypothetical protein